jgi:ankyrin repeat protein
MKVFLICLEGEKEKAAQIVSFLDKTGIPSKTYLIKTRDEGLKLIADYTHVVILSALGPGWIDFLAGFFCGSHLPLLVVGKKAIENIPVVFAFCFKFFDTEAKLHDYFVNELEISKKNEAESEVNHIRQALLDKGIPTTIDALAQCAAEDKVDEVSLFIAAGFLPDSKDKKGIPLLCIAARNGHLNTVEFLLRSGAKVDILADDRGSTPLIDTAMGRHKEVIKILIEAGADVNVKNRDGQTALIIVVGAGDVEIVEMLVKAGADPDIEDAFGVSARMYANIFKNEKIKAIFDAK